MNTPPPAKIRACQLLRATCLKRHRPDSRRMESDSSTGYLSALASVSALMAAGSMKRAHIDPFTADPGRHLVTRARMRRTRHRINTKLRFKLLGVVVLRSSASRGSPVPQAARSL